MPTYKHPIGLFGGTFDPVHLGHIEIAKQLFKQLNLSELQFIPNRQSPLRQTTMSSMQHRVNMLRIAIAENHHFVVSELEIARPPPSYTIDTLVTLRALIPKQPLCWILGSDAFNIFNRWYRWEDILKYTHLVVVSRPVGPLKLHEPWLHHLLMKHQTNKLEQLGTKVAGHILLMELKPIAISSSDIRQKIVAGEDVSGYLHPKVLQYIEQYSLYRGNP